MASIVVAPIPGHLSTRAALLWRQSVLIELQRTGYDTKNIKYINILLMNEYFACWGRVPLTGVLKGWTCRKQGWICRRRDDSMEAREKTVRSCYGNSMVGNSRPTRDSELICLCDEASNFTSFRRDNHFGCVLCNDHFNRWLIYWWILIISTVVVTKSFPSKHNFTSLYIYKLYIGWFCSGLGTATANRRYEVEICVALL